VATYYLTAERMQAHGYEPRKALYAKFQEAFRRAVQLARENCERVEIPYAHAHMAGLYVRAEGVSGHAPILVQINGLDSTKEMIYHAKVTFDGVLDRIRVRFLVAHGESDRQIALEYAHQTYNALINSSKRELKIFTPREGGIQHSSVVNSAFAMDYIADWVADNLGGRTA
jgi:hypothetical protein